MSLEYNNKIYYCKADCSANNLPSEPDSNYWEETSISALNNKLVDFKYIIPSLLGISNSEYQVENWDTFYYGVAYASRDAQGTKPSSNAHNILLALSFFGELNRYSIQLCFSFQITSIYYRTCNNGLWNPWVTVQTV